MKIKIKYFNNAKKLEKISKGDWIDVYDYRRFNSIWKKENTF